MMERRLLEVTYRDRKTNIWVREKTKVTHVTEQVRRRSGPGQGTLAGYEMTDGDCASPPGNLMKGNDQEEDRRDGGDKLDDYWKVPSGRGQCKIGRCGSSMPRLTHLQECVRVNLNISSNTLINIYYLNL